MKRKKELTRIIISFRSKYQSPLIMVIKEYYATKQDKKDNNCYWAEVLFSTNNIRYWAFLDIYATTLVETTKTYGSKNDGVYRPEKGAEFEVYNTETNQLVSKVVTDSDGKFTLDLGYGTYRIHQTKGKEKYDFVKDYTITIDGSTDKEVVFLQNEYITSDLDFTKTDISTGETLPNTTIEIYNAETDELVSTHVTDANGKVSIKNLGYGKYYILEKKAPAGYELNPERMYFEVTKSGEIIKVNMKDHKIKKVSSYHVPNTATNSSLSDVAVILMIIIVLGGAFIIVTNKKKDDK